jgi:hypothetical protein
MCKCIVLIYLSSSGGVRRNMDTGLLYLKGLLPVSDSVDTEVYPMQVEDNPPVDQPLIEPLDTRLLRKYSLDPDNNTRKRSMVMTFLEQKLPYETPYKPLGLHERVLVATKIKGCMVELRSTISVGLLNQTTLYWLFGFHCNPLHCHNMTGSMTLRKGPTPKRQVPLDLDYETLCKALTAWPIRMNELLCHEDCESRSRCKCPSHKNGGNSAGQSAASSTEPVKRGLGELSLTSKNPSKQAKLMVYENPMGATRDVCDEKDDTASFAGLAGPPRRSVSEVSSLADSSVTNSSRWSGMTDASATNRRDSRQYRRDEEWVVNHPAIHSLLNMSKLLEGKLTAEDVTPVVPSFNDGPVWTCPCCKMTEVDALHPEIESLQLLCEDPHHIGVIAHTTMRDLEVRVPNPPPPRISMPIEPMLLWDAMGVPSDQRMLFKAPKGSRKPTQQSMSRGIQSELTLLGNEIPSNAFSDSENPKQAFVDTVTAHYPPWVAATLPGHSAADNISRWAHYTGNCDNRESEQCCWFHCQWMPVANPGCGLGLHWDVLALQAVLGDASQAIDDLDAQSFVVDQLRLHQVRDSHQGMFSDKDYSNWDNSSLAYNRFRKYTLREHLNLQSGHASVPKEWTEYDAAKLCRAPYKTAVHPHINHMVFTEVDAVNLVCAGKEKLMAILWVDYAPRFHTPLPVPTPTSRPTHFLPSPAVRSVGPMNQITGGSSEIALQTSLTTRMLCTPSTYWQVCLLTLLTLTTLTTLLTLLTLITLITLITLVTLTTLITLITLITLLTLLTLITLIILIWQVSPRRQFPVREG